MNITQAIYDLYPQAKYTVGDVAYDAQDNEVVYDLEAVTAKAKANEQAIKNIKESALAKLAALGLTQDEVKALVG